MPEVKRKPKFGVGEAVRLLSSKNGLPRLGVIYKTDPHYSVEVFTYSGRMRRVPDHDIWPMTKREKGR